MKPAGSLSTINELLALACASLDQAASHISRLPLEPADENVRRVGETLVQIFEIQGRVYDRDPSLKPEHLNAPNPYPETSREYGALLVRIQRLQDAGELKQARGHISEFLTTDPPDLFADMARSLLANLKSDS